MEISHTLLVTEFAIFALYAMAWNLTLGATGLFSFGHGGLFGAGAYILAITTIRGDLPLPYALIAAPILTAVIALFMGWICNRLTGIYFAILTLAFGQLIWATIWKMRGITGGDDGLVGLQVPSLIATPINQYFFVLVLVAIAIVLMKIMLDSPFGFSLKAIRENQRRAVSIGINVKRYQLTAFTVSGFFTGLAGALFTILNRGAFIDYASVGRAFDPIFATILGGGQVFLGPLFGAGVWLALDKFISPYTEYWQLFSGLILISLVLFLPEGIVGRVQLLLKARAQRGKQALP